MNIIIKNFNYISLNLQKYLPQGKVWTPLDMRKDSVRRLPKSLLENYILAGSVRKLPGHYILEDFQRDFQNLNQI